MSAAFRRLVLLVLTFALTAPLLDARPKSVPAKPFQMAVPEIPYPEFNAPTETPYTLTSARTGRPAVGDSASFDVVMELEDASTRAERPPTARLPVAAFVRYPTAMLWSAITGEVVVRVGIDEAGNVSSVQLLRAPEPRFAAAVLKGLPRYRFSPATSGDVPVAFRGTYRVRFVMPDAVKPSA